MRQGAPRSDETPAAATHLGDPPAPEDSNSSRAAPDLQPTASSQRAGTAAVAFAKGGGAKPEASFRRCEQRASSQARDALDGSPTIFVAESAPSQR